MAIFKPKNEYAEPSPAQPTLSLDDKLAAAIEELQSLAAEYPERALDAEQRGDPDLLLDFTAKLTAARARVEAIEAAQVAAGRRAEIDAAKAAETARKKQVADVRKLLEQRDQLAGKVTTCLEDAAKFKRMLTQVSDKAAEAAGGSLPAGCLVTAQEINVAYSVESGRIASNRPVKAIYGASDIAPPPPLADVIREASARALATLTVGAS